LTIQKGFTARTFQLAAPSFNHTAQKATPRRSPHPAWPDDLRKNSFIHLPLKSDPLPREARFHWRNRALSILFIHRIKTMRPANPRAGTPSAKTGSEVGEAASRQFACSRTNTRKQIQILDSIRPSSICRNPSKNTKPITHMLKIKPGQKLKTKTEALAQCSRKARHDCRSNRRAFGRRALATSMALALSTVAVPRTQAKLLDVKNDERSLGFSKLANGAPLTTAKETLFFEEVESALKLETQATP